MQTAGGGFAAAVTAQDQLVDYQVTVTFPGGIQASYGDLSKSVVSIDVNRAVTTTLPNGTSMISGYPSAAATVVLQGLLNQNPGVPLSEAQSVYWLFNPNDATSPMWRQTCGGLPIVIQAGLWDGAAAADLVTIFTGTIDSVTCSNGVVTLVCRDARSTITSQAMLPPVITFPPHNAGLTSEYAVDYLARHASPSQYLSWPAQRANCVLAVGMRSSLWPEVGSYATFTQIPEFAPGVFGTAFTGVGNPNLVAYNLSTAILPGQSYFIEGFVSGTATNNNCDFTLSNVGGTYQITLEWLNDGNVYVFATSPGGSLGAASYALGSGSHYIALLAVWPSGSGTVTCHLRLDGVTHSFTTSVSGTLPSNITFPLLAVGGGSGTVEGVQVTTETAPAYNNAFSPTLILDPAGSLNSLTALPDVSGQDVWVVFQDIAAAEGATIGFDELGLLRFTNRQTIRTAAVTRTITSSQSLMTLDSLVQMSLCATHIQVPVNQIYIAAAAIVWQSSTPIQVNPGAPTVILATMSNPAVNIATTDSGFLNDGAPWSQAESWWMACTTADGTGTGIGSDVSFTVQQLSATQLRITITNTNLDPVFLVAPTGFYTPHGTAVLLVGGQPILATNNAVANNAVVVGGTTGGVIADAQYPDITNGGATANAQFGEILLTLPAIAWLQDIDSADAFADDLLADLFYPKPLYRNVTIVADPRSQLLDRVTLVDSDTSMINDDALLIGIETKIAAGQWMQTIDARAINLPGSWLLGVTGRSELGVTTYFY